MLYKLRRGLWLYNLSMVTQIVEPFFIYLTQTRPAKYDYIRGERTQMSIAAIITLSITIAGFIGGVIAALVKLGAIVGRLMERLESNEKRDSEERAKIEANFSELYGRMNATECEVKSQGTAINNLVATCSRIESKLDRIIEARG